MKTIRNYISKFWTSVFNDAPFVNELINATILMNDQLDTDIATMYNDLNRHDMDVFRTTQWLFVTYSESDMNLDVMDFSQTNVYFNGQFLFGTRGTETRFSLPIDSSIRSVPFILSYPAGAEVILQENIDYVVDSAKGYIFFKENPFNKNFQKKFIQTGAEPVMGIGMWFYGTNKDQRDLQNLYADPVKVSAQSSEYFKRVVNAIWDLRIEGGTVCNVMEMVCALTDCDLPKEAELVTRLFEEGGRKWIATDTHLYSAPGSASYLCAVGDTLTPCESAFDAVKIYTGDDVIPEDEFPAMHFGEGMIGSGFPGGITVENKDYPFPTKKVLIYDPVGKALVEDISALLYKYWMDKVTGYVIDVLVDDATANYTLVETYWDLPFRGQENTVLAFKNALVAVQASKSLGGIADITIANNGGLTPDTINLFREYQRNILKNNAFFLAINTNLVPAGVDPSIFINYIKYTIPAYTSMLTFLGSESSVSYATSNISEQVEAFYVEDVIGSYSTTNVSTRLDRKDSY